MLRNNVKNYRKIETSLNAIENSSKITEKQRKTSKKLLKIYIKKNTLESTKNCVKLTEILEKCKKLKEDGESWLKTMNTVQKYQENLQMLPKFW